MDRCSRTTRIRVARTVAPGNDGASSVMPSTLRVSLVPVPRSYEIDAYGISPSPDPAVYAYIKTTMHRNLFRIPVP
jgi:hypothetical protein